jgi:hypothetical protein
LVNVVDYFTEKFIKKRSDGTEGEKKSFGVCKELLKKRRKKLIV